MVNIRLLELLAGKEGTRLHLEMYLNVQDIALSIFCSPDQNVLAHYNL